MPATTLHLLGRPRVEQDGVEAPRPRGRKTWALLALLALSERPVSRERAAGLLFGEADDPLGALRWTLAEARRLTGVPLRGDPLLIEPGHLTVDALLLTTSSWVHAEAVARDGGSLLAGLSFPANPSFDAWLAAERHHLEATRAAVLREAALGRLAVGDTVGAVASARALVEAAPLDEAGHVLLVRALVESGARGQAEDAVRRCAEEFRRELGVAPSGAVQEELAVPAAPRSTSRAAGRALLDAGVAAISAGAVDVGLERLRDAVAVSHHNDDLHAEVQALCELGYALVHSVRGRDEAGATALSRAVALADAAGEPQLAVAAHRELGYTAFLAARYPEALRQLDHAAHLAGTSGEEAAAVAALRGACLTDLASYAEAAAALEDGVVLARAAGARRWLVWALTMSGRLHVLLEEHDLARPPLEEAWELARSTGWTSVLPWPQSLLAEVDLASGAVAQAEEAATHAFALGCELRDPCWEETAGRVLGLVALARGDADGARDILLDAAVRGARATDGWRFAHAEVLDTLASLAPVFPSQGLAWVVDLELIAAGGNMRELVVRAQLHRSALGQRGALEAALTLALGIDSPALTRRLTRAGATVASPTR